jgi:hypothetical protein
MNANTPSDKAPQATRRHMAARLAMLWLLTASAARADPAAEVEVDVNYLLDAIERSGCEFQRNGSWHNGHDAQVHLRGKFQALAARGLIATPEQFIEKAATQSSLTGRPYWVRCNGALTVSSRLWLGDELVRLRVRRAKPAPWAATPTLPPRITP